LPPECILIIIRILSDEDDMNTMAHLLCVNKAICAATLPFIYKDCFLRRMYARQQSGKSDEQYSTQLIRTFLRQVHPQSRIPDLLKVAFLPQDDQAGIGSTEKPSLPSLPSKIIPMFKYGYFLRMVHIYYEIGDWMIGFIHNNSSLMDYAATNRLYEKYVNEGLIVNNVRDECKDKVLELVLEMDIHRQLTWTIFQDHPETIEELTIPLKDIQRYIDNVYQFASLSNVSFSVRETGRYRYCMPVNGPNLHEIKQEERDRLFEGMVEFIRQHTAIHKSVLRNVEFPSPTELDGTDRHSRPDVYFTILSLLPPFQNVRSIRTDWVELLARHTDTNLGYMESIEARAYHREWKAEEESKLLSKYPPLLPRCRALKHLSADTLGPDMFHWAVLEKKKEETERQQESILCRQLCSWQQRHHNSSLVPLQSISMYNYKRPPLGQELNDIGFAFGGSLEELNVRDGIRHSERSVDQTTSCRIVLHGKGWNLPRLRTLSFEMFDLKLHFDMDGLQRSRALESLTMHDDMVTYSHRDIRSWSVVHLPHLRKLDLQGSPAIHFNMGSLHHSPCLEELDLKIAGINTPSPLWYYCIPSPEELMREDSDSERVDDHESSELPGSNQGYRHIGRRPRYTWDWHLSNLKELDLAAVFAFMFNFQWLQYLPNLHTFCLSTLSSINRLHERHITLKDLLKRGQQHQLDEDGSSEILSDRYISLPKLESIELDGSWVFEEKVLETLFLAVAPNLHWVSFGRDCTGFTLEECIALSRKMPQMEKVYLSMQLTRDEIQNLELVSTRDAQGDQRKKRRVAFVLSAGVFYDVLEP
ncbi:hypothetical protein BGX34_005309, partial [Mortierella sp. NVP85]